MCTSVDRIFSIWQERSVYPEELISELKASLQKKEKEKEKKEKLKEKEEKEEKLKEQQPSPGQFLSCTLPVFVIVAKTNKVLKLLYKMKLNIHSVYKCIIYFSVF